MTERDLLTAGLRELGVAECPSAVDNLLRYSEILREKNKVMNLTAITEREEQYTTEANGLSMVREDDPLFDVYKELEDYEKEFSNLSVGVSKGRKLPHKAILLMALMKLIATGKIIDNRIELDNVIVNAFSSMWNQYYDTKVPTVWTPFYHLKGESFWHFKANGNEEKLTDLLSFGGTPSIGKMRPIIKYAFLDKALFDYM